VTLALQPVSPDANDISRGVIQVVLADDSAAIRTLARHALSARQGFCVIAEAANGAEALALTDRHRPDCLILDIGMPGLDGFEVLAEMQHRFPTIPVVMLSGFADEAVTERAMAGGAAAYLNKSSDLKHLAATIRRVSSPTAEAASDVATTTNLPPVAEAGVRTTIPAHRVSAYSTPATAYASAAATAAAVTGPATGQAGVAAVSTDLQVLQYVLGQDFTEPLRVMSGFASLLQSRYAEALDDTGRSFVDHIVESAARMQTTVDALVAFTEAGQAQPQSEPVNPGEVVRAVYTDLAEEIAERGAEATVGDLPSVVADPQLLATVLHHLVRNAIVFNTSSLPTVRVTGEVRDGFAAITVKDNGIGVAPADHARVFNLFQRLDTSQSHDATGIGVGLAMCRRLVDLQGGQIRLDSQPDQGTIVTLTLPLHPVGNETPVEAS